MICWKKPFSKYNDARNALKMTRRREKNKNLKPWLHIYLCKGCNAWHVGHSQFKESGTYRRDKKR